MLLVTYHLTCRLFDLPSVDSDDNFRAVQHFVPLLRRNLDLMGSRGDRGTLHDDTVTNIAPLNDSAFFTNQFLLGLKKV